MQCKKLKGKQNNHQIACLLWGNDILWFHSSIEDRLLWGNDTFMISFPHGKRESLFVCFKGRSGYRACPGLPLCLTNRIRICRVPKKVLSSLWTTGVYEKHRQENLFHHSDFINATIRECTLYFSFSKALETAGLMTEGGLKKRTFNIAIVT